MTSPLFTEWIQQHDRRFAKQKRRVVFVIDNCPAHPHINGLKAIKLQFLPPNTTSKTQPMDQGIIANIKHHYRSTILQQLICAIDQGKPTTINVLEAMRAIRKAWDNVKPTTKLRSLIISCNISVVCKKLYVVLNNESENKMKAINFVFSILRHLPYYRSFMIHMK